MIITFESQLNKNNTNSNYHFRTVFKTRGLRGMLKSKLFTIMSISLRLIVNPDSNTTSSYSTDILFPINTCYPKWTFHNSMIPQQEFISFLLNLINKFLLIPQITGWTKNTYHYSWNVITTCCDQSDTASLTLLHTVQTAVYSQCFNWFWLVADFQTENE